MGRNDRTRTAGNEEDSTTSDRSRRPTDRSGSDDRERVPPARGHGHDRDGSADARTGSNDGSPPRALRRADGPGNRSRGLRDRARALAGRIAGNDRSERAPDDAGDPSTGPAPEEVAARSAGTAPDAGDAGRIEGSPGEEREPTATDGDTAGLGETLREKFPELDVGTGDLGEVQWRNVVKKIVITEMKTTPGVGGLLAGADELHQQLSQGDPLDGRVGEIHDRLGEYPPPERWAETITERTLREAGAGVVATGTDRRR